MINRIPQRQVKAVIDDHTNLEQQLNAVENRTRVIAKINYNSKTQWDLGTKTRIDSDTELDQIQLDKDGETFYANGEYLTYEIDMGAFNVAFESFEYTHTKPAGASIAYYTRTGDVDVVDETWSDWQAVTVAGVIQSPNARYVQIKITLATTINTSTPRVDEVVISLWSNSGVQDLYDARGGYKTLADRLSNLGSVYHLKVIPEDAQTDITLSKMVVDGTTLKVYVNGSLQNEGSNEEDAYTIVNSTIVRFNEGLVSDDVIVCRIEGAGAGVVTVKENRRVGEIPTTSDNITYTLSRLPIVDKEEVYIGGIKMLSGAENDYTVDEYDIIFNYTVNSSFVVDVTYLYI